MFDNPKLIINQVQCICCNFETFARDSNLRVSLCGILIGYAKLRNKIYASNNEYKSLDKSNLLKNMFQLKKLTHNYKDDKAYHFISCILFCR